MHTITWLIGSDRCAQVEYGRLTNLVTQHQERFNVKQLTDADLLAAIARQNEAALAELYDRYCRLIFTIAYNVVGNEQTAEEVTLDIFVRVWQKAHTYQADQAQVHTWLTRITRNRAIDMLRREAVRPIRHSIPWGSLTDEPKTRQDDPETAVFHTLQRQRVRAALILLSDSQREVLLLAFFKGYSHSQIAELLQQPLGTVKGRIRAAMQKLRLLLEDEHVS
ncbi:MAG: sigma-70 family RNA polymerase sigma factor [Anaerolineales bacterium]|nr:sigma-70 family RNA polymerase sigma factor [Anaerolineales bacterium]